MLNVVDIRNKGIKAVDEEIESNGVAILTYRGKLNYFIHHCDCISSILLWKNFIVSVSI